MAANIIKRQVFQSILELDGTNRKSVRNILIYNQNQNVNRDLQLIQSIYMRIINEYVDEQKPDDHRRIRSHRPLHLISFPLVRSGFPPGPPGGGGLAPLTRFTLEGARFVHGLTSRVPAIQRSSLAGAFVAITT